MCGPACTRQLPARRTHVGIVSSSRNPKSFQDSLSHRILRHMHEALNIDENKNQLHSVTVKHETNLLTLVSLWLDNIYHKQTKVLQQGRTVRPRLACMPGARDRHGGRSRQAVHAYACVCVWPVVPCTTAVRPCFKWFRYRNTFVCLCQKYYSIMN